MTLNVLTANPVLKTSAKTLAKHHTTHVGSKLNAELFIIVLYANVLLNGLGILMFNAFNVSFSLIVHLVRSYQGEYYLSLESKDEEYFAPASV